jgi:hypothetical protein
MARFLQQLRTAIGVYDRVMMSGTRYVMVLSDDRLLVLRHEKSNVHVTVTQREFAELLAIREATIDRDYFLNRPRLFARSHSSVCFKRLVAAQGVKRANVTYPEIADQLGPELTDSTSIVLTGKAAK